MNHAEAVAALTDFIAAAERLRAALGPAHPETLLTVKQAAHAAGLSEKTVVRWCLRHGCGTKVGRSWRVSVPALVAQRRIGLDDDHAWSTKAWNTSTGPLDPPRKTGNSGPRPLPSRDPSKPLNPQRSTGSP